MRRALIWITSAAVVIVVFVVVVRRQNSAATFARLDELFAKTPDPFFQNLHTYGSAVGHCKAAARRPLGVLLIGGFRETPLSWKTLARHLEDDGIDYFAPLTRGSGRTFFQEGVTWQDWVLGYFESLSFMMCQYEAVSIVAHSAGTNIALYLAEREWPGKSGSRIVASIVYPSMNDMRNELEKQGAKFLY